MTSLVAPARCDLAHDASRFAIELPGVTLHEEQQNDSEQHEATADDGSEVQQRPAVAGVDHERYAHDDEHRRRKESVPPLRPQYDRVLRDLRVQRLGFDLAAAMTGDRMTQVSDTVGTQAFAAGPADTYRCDRSMIETMHALTPLTVDRSAALDLSHRDRSCRPAP